MADTPAQTRLKAMTASSAAPALSDTEIAALLSLASLADSGGLAPADASWIPTYDFNRAAAEGWRWKAAKAAAGYGFTADGATYQREQIMDHCNKMIAQYQRKIASSAFVYAPLAAAYPAEVPLDDSGLPT
jgi:hypothetical protein